VKAFEKEYLEYLKAKHSETLTSLKNGNYTDAETSVLASAAAEMTARYA
jgi:F-type H+-transporting ATPase subunit alpha